MSLVARVAPHIEGFLGAVELNREFEIVEVTDGVLEVSGFGAEQLLGKSALMVVHPADHERAAEVLDEVRAITGRRPEGVYRLRIADGTYRHLTIRAQNLGDDGDGAIVLEFGEPTPEVQVQSFADTAVEAMHMLVEEISLEESLDRLALVAERAVDGLSIVVTVFGERGGTQVISRQPTSPAVLAVNEAATASALPAHVQVAFDSYQERAWRFAKKIATVDDAVPGRLTSVLAHRDGSIGGYVEAFRRSETPPDDSEWLVYAMVSRMMNIAFQRDALDRELRRAAEIDPLTGLLNRRKLFEVLGADSQLPGSLLYLIDLDRFSWVNNNLGHQVGDATLAAVAQALRASCPDEALIARLGGDEFVVWIPAERAGHDLEELGSILSEAMVVPAGSGDKRVFIRASIGMVRIEAGEIVADALARADMAMYAAKRSGGDSVTAG